MLYDPQWEEKVTVEPWRQVLLNAADLLEREGWTQGSFENGYGYCAAGAIQRCSPNDRQLQGLVLRYLRNYINFNHGDISIAAWNDAHFQDKRNVVATLRSCARQK